MVQSLLSPSRRLANDRASHVDGSNDILNSQSDAPGYYEIVKKPMDLKTIKEKIKNGSIANLDDMHSAMLTMFA